MKPGQALRAGEGKTRRPAFDAHRLRADFPILAQTVRGKPLVYLDNAATTQKPRSVIDAISGYYERDNSNIHRGLHVLSERATAAYESARETAARFLNAAESREIVFVRGTTEGINLVAQTYGRREIGRGDEIVVTTMEHHSNIVPWQMLCEEKGAVLRVAPINDAGEIILDRLGELLGPRTKLVALVHQSNALGTVNPVREIVRMAHARGVPVLLDGAQSAAHMVLDVQDLDCDFYTFSGHKLYGPTGIGVLYGKSEWLERMPPYQGGGDMISSVTFEKTSYNRVPAKFEAGTPNVAGVVGLAAALDFITGIDRDAAAAHEQDLLERACRMLSGFPEVRLIGTAADRASVLSFVVKDIHPHDIGTILDQEGVAIRAGHHCTQPLMQRFGVPATARASFGLYNVPEEIDALERGIHRVLEVFR